MAAIAADEEFSSDSEADVADDGVAEDGVAKPISHKPKGGKEQKKKVTRCRWWYDCEEGKNGE